MTDQERKPLLHLLSVLRTLEVGQLLTDHYMRYGNTAPPLLYESAVKDAEKVLEGK